MNKGYGLFCIGIMIVLLCSCGITGEKNRSLRIVGFNISQEQIELIETFKENYPDVDVQVIDYAQYGDRQSALQRLNADIIGKNAGDVLIANTLIPLDTYIEKDVLWNLQEAEGIDEVKKLLLPSVLRACERDGNIYSIFSEFSIYCFVGKEEIISAELWNSQSICHLVEPFIEKEINIFSGQSKEIYQSMLENMIIEDIKKDNELTQEENIICFMEKSKQLIEIANSSKIVEPWNVELYRSSQIPLSIEYIDNFDSYYYLQKVKYDSNIVLLGYPTENNKPLFSTSSEFSVFNFSENKELAWEFISFFLMEKNQMLYLEEDSVAFPVNQKIFQKVYDAVISGEILDEDSACTIEEKYSYNIDGKEVNLGIPTKLDLQPLINTIDCMENIHKYDVELENIIDKHMEQYWFQSGSSENIYIDMKNSLNLYIEEKK